MTKKVIEVELEDLTYRLEGTLADLKVKVDNLLSKHGPEARLDISIDHSYGDSFALVSLKGKREETQSEYEKRLATERAWKLQQDERDAREFERLKAKFKE